jgi:hypothetical protein
MGMGIEASPGGIREAPGSGSIGMAMDWLPRGAVMGRSSPLGNAWAKATSQETVSTSSLGKASAFHDRRACMDRLHDHPPP